MTNLRAVFGGLFVGGCWFSLFTWILVIAPIGLVFPKYHYTTHEAVLSLLGCGLAVAGYFVWINWFVFAVRGRFLLVSGVTAQAISFVQHLGWLLFLPLLRREWLWETATRLPWVTVWIVANAVVAVAAGLVFLFAGEDGTKSDD